ncbi:MAG TPA: dihydropteroate synthase [Methylomirabilota bacterium]|jgi:dihydropteroate synthase|nr:dihydropteroate synthase [Methylomirabilota bacterium]
MTNQACLAGITVGDDHRVAVVGALNVSPESFYRGSVVTEADDLLAAAEAMARAGAAFLDVGAMSTAPYLATRIPESQEAERLAWAVELLVSKLDLPVSADTTRSLPARAALEAGARIINDVSGLTADPVMAPVVARAGAGLIVMAAEREDWSGADPVAVVRALLAESLAIARAADIDPSRIVVDPGIGFFRGQGTAWHQWDCAVLARLPELGGLGRPICVGVSRKSFIGALAGEGDPARRLPGSLAATAAAVLGGARLIRAHDVPETVQAVRVAEAIRRAGGAR